MTIENTEQVKTTEQSEGWDFDHALTVSKTNIEVAWALEVAENLGTIPKNKNTEDAIVALKKGEMPELSHLQSHYNALQRKLNSISNEKEQKAAEYKKRTFRAVEPGVEIPVHRIEGKGKKVVISPGSFTGPEHVGEYAIATALHGNDVTVPELLLSEHGDPTAKTTQLMNAYSRSIEVDTTVQLRNMASGKKLTWTLAAAAPGQFPHHFMAAANNRFLYVFNIATGAEEVSLYCKSPIYCLTAGPRAVALCGDAFGNVYCMRIANPFLQLDAPMSSSAAMLSKSFATSAMKYD
jgi:hypothetical protein